MLSMIFITSYGIYMLQKFSFTLKNVTCSSAADRLGLQSRTKDDAFTFYGFLLRIYGAFPCQSLLNSDCTYCNATTV